MLQPVQVQVPVLSAGRNIGAVTSLQKDGLTYVDVQQTARRAGAGISLFATSKQVKISAKGFYAIWRDNRNKLRSYSFFRVYP